MERKLRLSRANYLFCRFPTTGLLLSFSIDFPSGRIFIIITSPRRSYKPLCRPRYGLMLPLHAELKSLRGRVRDSRWLFRRLVSRGNAKRDEFSVAKRNRVWSLTFVDCSLFFLDRVFFLSRVSFEVSLEYSRRERVVSDDNVKSRPPRNAFVINFCFEWILENRGQVFWKCGIM